MFVCFCRSCAGCREYTDWCIKISVPVICEKKGESVWKKKKKKHASLVRICRGSHSHDGQTVTQKWTEACFIRTSIKFVERPCSSWPQHSTLSCIVVMSCVGSQSMPSRNNKNSSCLTVLWTFLKNGKQNTLWSVVLDLRAFLQPSCFLLVSEKDFLPR